MTSPEHWTKVIISSSLVKLKMTMIMLLKQFSKICWSNCHTQQKQIWVQQTKHFTFWICIFRKGYLSRPNIKVEYNEKALTPITTHALRRLLRMAKYCAKFIPNFSDIPEPLRKLIKKDETFLWGEEQKRSFHNYNKEPTHHTDVMMYLDPSKETVLITDASPLGLSAILM